MGHVQTYESVSIWVRFPAPPRLPWIEDVDGLIPSYLNNFFLFFSRIVLDIVFFSFALFQLFVVLKFTASRPSLSLSAAGQSQGEIILILSTE
jgi:hypothetical protein